MPTKAAINLVGAVASGALIFAGGFLVAKPQFGSASDYADKEREVASSVALEETRLIKLKAEAENLEALKQEVTNLKISVPSEPDIAGLARVAVEATPPNVVLEAFIHRPLELVAPIEVPSVNFEVPEAPVDEAAPTVVGPELEPSGPPVLQRVPLVIKASGPSSQQLALYMDNLSKAPRAIVPVFTQETQVVGETSTVYTLTIYAFAYVNAPSATPPAPATEDGAEPAPAG